MRLVCRLWNAVIISTPSLWAQLGTDSQYRSNIDILSIWLERSKTCPLHIRLYLPIEPQCLSVLTSSVERWESLEFIVLRVHRQISSVDIFPCLAPDDSDTFVFMTSIARCHETFIIALIETTPNLKFLSIDYRLDRHCAYSPLMDSLFNLSYLHLYYKALDCERTWNMLLVALSCISIVKEDSTFTHHDQSRSQIWKSFLSMCRYALYYTHLHSKSWILILVARTPAIPNG